MTVKRLLSEIDSDEIAEWIEFDKRWPLPDHWAQTARLCRIVMAASGNYKRVPEERVFIPATVSPNQTPEEMLAELSKLKR